MTERSHLSQGHIGYALAHTSVGSVFQLTRFQIKHRDSFQKGPPVKSYGLAFSILSRRSFIEQNKDKS